MAAKSGWSTSTIAGAVGNDQASNNSSGFTGIPIGDRAYFGPFSNNNEACTGGDLTTILICIFPQYKLQFRHGNHITSINEAAFKFDV